MSAHVTLAEALGKLDGPERSVKLFGHGTLRVKMYAPRGKDEQTPHQQDEIYVIARGSGRFSIAGEEVSFGPGDFLFAPASLPHRFVKFTDDFATFVFFYGPEGGEGDNL
jgi:mannose-6-phosphate isomerase-like protein (cupin superfamily)